MFIKPTRLVKMIISVKTVKNRHLKRFIEHSIYFFILVILIPAYFYFELCIVLPAVVKEKTEQLVHFFIAFFLLLNIVGNLIYGVMIDTSIRGRILNYKNDGTWQLCTVCECYRPPRAWHCELCNICILKRDHHCTFFACCVGYYNFRYFIMFTMYVFIAMVYALSFNIKFLALFLTWNHGLVIAKFLFPFAGFVLDFGSESLYVFLVVINVVIIGFTGFLFFYHLKNILSGKTVPENKNCKNNLKNDYDKGWKLNIVEVLGYRWYLAWILPHINSPLPGNGMEWDSEDKYK